MLIVSVIKNQVAAAIRINPTQKVGMGSARKIKSEKITPRKGATA